MKTKEEQEFIEILQKLYLECRDELTYALSMKGKEGAARKLEKVLNERFGVKTKNG